MLVENINEWIFDPSYLVVIYVVGKKVKKRKKKLINFHYIRLIAATAAKSLQSCLTLCNPIDGGPLSLGFSRQEHWSGLPFPSPAHESEKQK